MLARHVARTTTTAVVTMLTGLALCGAASPPDGPPQEPQGRPGTAFAPVVEGGRVVEVADDTALREALDGARAGDVIRLAPGGYEAVTITGDGTAEAPITLVGPPDAVFSARRGYVVHVEDASHWQLVGFTVRGGGKGVVVDGGRSVLLDSLTVGGTGEEAVHFRSASSDNVVQRSRIHDTGLRKPQFGEGVYVGSARSNWDRYGEDGGPDLSMRNRVLGNVFEGITAENVDIKEETAGTVVARNRFDGSAISGENFADSVVDVKGYDSLVVDNTTTGRSPELRNIIETHVITEPATSGCGNTFEGNTVQGFVPTGGLVVVDRRCR